MLGNGLSKALQNVTQPITTYARQSSDNTGTDVLALIFVLIMIGGVLISVAFYLPRAFRKKGKVDLERLDRMQTVAYLRRQEEDLLRRQIQGFIIYVPIIGVGGMVALSYLRWAARMPITGMTFNLSFLIAAGVTGYLVYYLFRLWKYARTRDWIITRFWFLPTVGMSKHLGVVNAIEVRKGDLKGKTDYLRSLTPHLCPSQTRREKIVNTANKFIVDNKINGSERLTVKNADSMITAVESKYNELNDRLVHILSNGTGIMLLPEEVKEKVLEKSKGARKSDDKAPEWLKKLAKGAVELSKGAKDAIEPLNIIHKITFSSIVHDIESYSAGLQAIKLSLPILENRSRPTRKTDWMKFCTTCREKCPFYTTIRNLETSGDFTVVEFDIEQWEGFEKMIGIFRGHNWRHALGKQTLQVYVKKVAVEVIGSLGDFLFLEITKTIKMPSKKGESPRLVYTPVVYCHNDVYRRDGDFAGLGIATLDYDTFIDVQQKRFVPESLALVQYCVELEARNDELQRQVLWVEKINSYDKFNYYIKHYLNTDKMPRHEGVSSDTKNVLIAIVLGIVVIFGLIVILPRLGIGL